LREYFSPPVEAKRKSRLQGRSIAEIPPSGLRSSLLTPVNYSPQALRAQRSYFFHLFTKVFGTNENHQPYGHHELLQQSCWAVPLCRFSCPVKFLSCETMYFFCFTGTEGQRSVFNRGSSGRWYWGLERA